MTARAAVLTPLGVAALFVLFFLLLALAVQEGLFAPPGGHLQPRPVTARILPAPVPNAVPFTGPLPSYRPAAGHG